jgi:hypothetical protein
MAPPQAAPPCEPRRGEDCVGSAADAQPERVIQVAPSAIPSFFETKESSGVQNRSEKNRIVVF